MKPRIGGRTLLALMLAGTMAWAIQACSGGATPDTATAVTSSSGVSSDGTTASHNGGPTGVPASPAPGARPDHPQGPPPEAVAACASRTDGASCTFTAPWGDVEGTCHSGPDGSGSLACAPNDHHGPGGPGHPPDGGQGPHGGPQGGPPPEAVAACAKLASGTGCSFTAPFGTVTGTCQTGPNGGALACAPAGHGPR